jgi:DNA-binding CsgD family transcriptional regulator
VQLLLLGSSNDKIAQTMNTKTASVKQMFTRLREHLGIPYSRGHQTRIALINFFAPLLPPKPAGVDLSTASTLFPPRRPDRLNALQEEIVDFVVANLTNPEIAARKEIPVDSVKKQVSEIYDILELKSRAQLVIWGRSHRSKNLVPEYSVELFLPEGASCKARITNYESAWQFAQRNLPGARIKSLKGDLIRIMYPPSSNQLCGWIARHSVPVGFDVMTEIAAIRAATGATTGWQSQ